MASKKYHCSTVLWEDAAKMPSQLYCMLISMSSFCTRTNLIQQSEHRNGILSLASHLSHLFNHFAQATSFNFIFFKLVTSNRAWSNPQKCKWEIFSPLQWYPCAHRPLHLYLDTKDSSRGFRDYWVPTAATDLREEKRRTNLWFKKFLSCSDWESSQSTAG